MRTTIAIDDDVLEAARKLAAARDESLGRVVSDLMRQGLAFRRAPPVNSRGLPTFQVREDSPPLTLEDVKRDEDEPD
jgi:hypothetical protein